MKFAEIIDESWGKSDVQFNDKYFKDSVALAILFKHTEWVVSHQPWFEQGYRANIVTYSIALLHRLIVQQFKGMDLDLQLIWNRQQVPDAVTNELVKITKYVFDTITDQAEVQLTLHSGVKGMLVGKVLNDAALSWMMNCVLCFSVKTKQKRLKKMPRKIKN